MAHELFVTFNSQSLFLELLSEYTKATERGLITLVKIKGSSADMLKLPEMPFLIDIRGELHRGETVLSETIAKIAGVYETLFGRTLEASQSHLDFFKTYRDNCKTPQGALTYLNRHLLRNTFCNGNHITISDLFAYADIVSLVCNLPDEEKWLYNNIVRWVDHIQSLPGLREKIRELRLRLALPYEPLFLEADNTASKSNEGKKDKKDAKREAKEAFLAKGGMIKKDKVEETKGTEQISTNTNKQVSVDTSKTNPKTETKVDTGASNTTAGANNVKQEAKQETKPKQKQVAKAPQKAKDPLDDAHPVSKLDIRVGKVISIAVNENSEKLYNEEIDLGNGEIRKIASGLKGRVNIEDLRDSMVIVLANLKERALCGWPSHGMILCASDEKGNIEPIRPAAGSQPGDLVHIGDFPRTPVPELNPKKSPWEAVQPEMTVDETNTAVFQKTAKWRTDKGEIRTKSVNAAKIS